MIRAVFVLFACMAGVAPALAATPCEALARLKLPGTSIASAETVPAGGFTLPGGKPMATLPAFCRLAGTISPAADSNIRFEVWMPGSGWNGKFEGAGNGGFAGAINYADMASAISHGYATASTDTGHQAGGTDAAWAQGHLEKISDFGFRAIHETAEKAKAFIGAFYGQTPRHSYFASCSNGGRQALMEAQRFPADYDGIIAGAPANFWTHLLAAAAFDIQATLADAGSYIPARKLPAIQAAVLSACDALDGVKDGVIENPAQCHFEPATLLCRGQESDSCLTAAQVEALTKIYRGPRNSKGEQVFPGYSPGGEAESGGWGPWITGAAPQQSLMYAFGTQFFEHMVYPETGWDFRTFQVDRDTKIADDKMGRILNSADPDLNGFKKRGGKLIIYHGWSDAAIPAQSTIDYFRSVVSKMGAKDSASFVRLFMVPGMQHCGGGSGTDSFGAGVAQGDAQHDMGRALERWVEEGVAPEQIVATRYKSGSNAASGMVRARPLCAYPQIAKWKGSGSTDDAANFVCMKADAPTSR